MHVPPTAIVGLPSLDLGPRYAARTDLASFETRWLYLLLALRDPAVSVAVVTSDSVPEWEVGYYLRLAGIDDPPGDRLLMLAVEDLSRRPLAQKLIERPDLIDRIRAFGATAERAWTVPFGVSTDDETVAAATGVPLYGIASRFHGYGTKSGGRRLFREEGVAHPRGVEGVRDLAGVSAAVAALRDARAVVVKLDVGVTGDGNAVLHTAEPGPLPAAIAAGLAGGAVVEELVDGADVSSPSAQVRIHPGGDWEVIATHDQVLGGPLGQTYTAAHFPAGPRSAVAIAREAGKVAARLAREGAIGRFAVDFVLADGCPYAVELNLREGATTHPRGTLELLAGGGYDAERAVWIAADGAERHYYATDAIIDPALRAIDPRALIDAVRDAGLEYDAGAGEGVVLFMLRALPLEGRVGIVAIARSRAAADALQRDFRSLLLRRAGQSP